MGKKLLKTPQALWSKTSNQATPKKKKKGKRPTARGNPYRYGVLSSGTGDARVVYHGGAHVDTRTLMHFYPKKKTGVVIYANGDDSYVNLDRILNAVLWHLKIGKGTLKILSREAQQKVR